MWGDMKTLESNQADTAESDAALVLPPDLSKVENKPAKPIQQTEGNTDRLISEPETVKIEQTAGNEKIVNLDSTIANMTESIQIVENRIKNLLAEQESIKTQMNESNEKEKNVLARLDLAQRILKGFQENLQQLEAIDESMTAVLGKN